MRHRGFVAAAAAAFVMVVALAGCSTVAVSVPNSAAPSPRQDVPTPTPTSTPTPAVTWQDPDALIILPSATNPDAPHGPSWVSQDGTMMCGIYDNVDRYSESKGDLGTGLYYGCRLKYGANRFTYPPTKYAGETGGCPSGFAANGGEAATTLCNSGQVFASETGGATALMPGNGVRFDGVECVATAAGMTCTETATGHGFQVTLDAFSLS